MKYIYDMDDAKNIVHEVFMSFWEKFEHLPEGSSHKTYLYTAVKNKSLNFIRDKKKHVILEDAEDVAWLKRARRKKLSFRPLEEVLADLPKR